MTENKRYFARWYETEYYIFDSNTITEKQFDENYTYKGYRAFEDSMQGTQVEDTLNKQYEENMQITCENKELQEHIVFIESALQSTIKNERLSMGRNALIQFAELIGVKIV